MRQVRFYSIVFLALALAACTNTNAETALMAQQALVGMPKSALLSCAGVPQRSAFINNREYLTYESARTEVWPQSNVGFYGGRRHFGYGYGFGMPLDNDDVRTYTCTATFTLHNGVVERVVYGGEGDAGAGRLGQCYHIVENCIGPVTP